MTRKRRPAKTIGELLEQWRRGEGPRVHDVQATVVVVVEDILEKLKMGFPLNDDDREFVTICLESMSLPVIRGRLPKSEQTKANEAAAKIFARAQVKKLKTEGVPATEAWERTAHMIKQRWPQYQGKSTKTIVDRMQRRADPGVF